MFKMAIFSVTILLLAGLVYAQCGPNPITTPGMAPMSTPNLQQQRAQQKQIELIKAQTDFQTQMQQLQSNMRISQIQNQGNPQMMQQMQQNYAQQMQQLQQNFQQTVRRIQSQP